MSNDFIVEDVDRLNLTGMSHLDDHAIALCPDGMFFHLSSGKLATDNDSGYAFTYNEDFLVIESGAISERDSNLKFNDMPLLCSENGQFSAFLDFEYSWPVFMQISRSGEILNEVTLGQLPVPEGSSLIQHPDGESLIYISTTKDTRGLNLAILGADFTFIESLEIASMEAGTRSHWPQGAIIIGDRLFVSYVRQVEAEEWNDDWGEIWLAIFDMDWNMLEDFVVVDTESPDGAMRPSLTQSDNTLVLSYDRIDGGGFGQVSPRMVVMELDDSLFHVQDDSDDTGMDNEAGGCGCNATKNAPPQQGWFGYL